MQALRSSNKITLGLKVSLRIAISREAFSLAAGAALLLMEEAF